MSRIKITMQFSFCMVLNYQKHEALINNFLKKYPTYSISKDHRHCKQSLTDKLITGENIIKECHHC